MLLIANAHLKMKMEKAIQAENFEEAAKLRDQIRELEKQDQGGSAKA